ncbi:MAG: imidazole glycerol phosphate synthase subunit HisH [Rhodospirillaceae bacterium]
MIGILDLGMGNLRSLSNAIQHNGFDVQVTEDQAPFDDFTHLIIPGVGHFRAAMAAVTERDLRPHIRAFAATGKPVLGVCLGMQLLSATGTEGGESEGLGLIAGTVRRLDLGPEYRVPHVGWNSLSLTRAHPVYEGLKADRDFYFVHSFAVVCDRAEDVLGETDYGGPVTAAVGHATVVGFQFHPEKSEANGLKLLENFCLWDGRC